MLAKKILQVAIVASIALFSVSCAGTDTSSSHSAAQAVGMAGGQKSIMPANMRARLAPVLAQNWAARIEGEAEIESTVNTRTFELGAVYSSFLIRFRFMHPGALLRAPGIETGCLLVIRRGTKDGKSSQNVFVQHIGFQPRAGDLATRTCDGVRFEPYTELNRFVREVNACKAVGKSDCKAPESAEKLAIPNFLQAHELAPSKNFKQVLVLNEDE